MYMELLYHVPLSIWAVPALLRNDAKVPLHLLVWAVQTGMTTLTCVADYLSWSGYKNAEKLELGKLYVPYLALGECFLLSGVIGGMAMHADGTFSDLYGCGYVWQAGC